MCCGNGGGGGGVIMWVLLVQLLAGPCRGFPEGPKDSIAEEKNPAKNLDFVLETKRGEGEGVNLHLIPRRGPTHIGMEEEEEGHQGKGKDYAEDEGSRSMERVVGVGNAVGDGGVEGGGGGLVWNGVLSWVGKLAQKVEGARTTECSHAERKTNRALENNRGSEDSRRGIISDLTNKISTGGSEAQVSEWLSSITSQLISELEKLRAVPGCRNNAKLLPFINDLLNALNEFPLNTETKEDSPILVKGNVLLQHLGKHSDEWRKSPGAALGEDCFADVDHQRIDKSIEELMGAITPDPGQKEGSSMLHLIKSLHRGILKNHEMISILIENLANLNRLPTARETCEEECAAPAVAADEIKSSPKPDVPTTPSSLLSTTVEKNFIVESANESPEFIEKNVAIETSEKDDDFMIDTKDGKSISLAVERRADSGTIVEKNFMMETKDDEKLEKKSADEERENSSNFDQGLSVEKDFVIETKDENLTPVVSSDESMNANVEKNFVIETREGIAVPVAIERSHSREKMDGKKLEQFKEVNFVIESKVENSIPLVSADESIQGISNTDFGFEKGDPIEKDNSGALKEINFVIQTKKGKSITKAMKKISSDQKYMKALNEKNFVIETNEEKSDLSGKSTFTEKNFVIESNDEKSTPTVSADESIENSKQLQIETIKENNFVIETRDENGIPAVAADEKEPMNDNSTRIETVQEKKFVIETKDNKSIPIVTANLKIEDTTILIQDEKMNGNVSKIETNQENNFVIETKGGNSIPVISADEKITAKSQVDRGVQIDPRSETTSEMGMDKEMNFVIEIKNENSLPVLSADELIQNTFNIKDGVNNNAFNNNESEIESNKENNFVVETKEGRIVPLEIKAHLGNTGVSQQLNQEKNVEKELTNEKSFVIETKDGYSFPILMEKAFAQESNKDLSFDDKGNLKHDLARKSSDQSIKKRNKLEIPMMEKSFVLETKDGRSIPVVSADEIIEDSGHFNENLPIDKQINGESRKYSEEGKKYDKDFVIEINDPLDKKNTRKMGPHKVKKFVLETKDGLLGPISVDKSYDKNTDGHGTIIVDKDKISDEIRYPDSSTEIASKNVPTEYPIGNMAQPGKSLNTLNDSERNDTLEDNAKPKTHSKNMPIEPVENADVESVTKELSDDKLSPQVRLTDKSGGDSPLNEISAPNPTSEGNSDSKSQPEITSTISPSKEATTVTESFEGINYETTRTSTSDGDGNDYNDMEPNIVHKTTNLDDQNNEATEQNLVLPSNKKETESREVTQANMSTSTESENKEESTEQTAARIENEITTENKLMTKDVIDDMTKEPIKSITSVNKVTTISTVPNYWNEATDPDTTTQSIQAAKISELTTIITSTADDLLPSSESPSTQNADISLEPAGSVTTEQTESAEQTTQNTEIPDVKTEKDVEPESTKKDFSKPSQSKEASENYNSVGEDYYEDKYRRKGELEEKEKPHNLPSPETDQNLRDHNRPKMQAKEEPINYEPGGEDYSDDYYSSPEQRDKLKPKNDSKNTKIHNGTSGALYSNRTVDYYELEYEEPNEETNKHTKNVVKKKLETLESGSDYSANTDDEQSPLVDAEYNIVGEMKEDPTDKTKQVSPNATLIGAIPSTLGNITQSAPASIKPSANGAVTSLNSANNIITPSPPTNDSSSPISPANSAPSPGFITAPSPHHINDTLKEVGDDYEEGGGVEKTTSHVTRKVFNEHQVITLFQRKNMTLPSK